MLIGYWKSHPWTPLATARRYSTVELLGWTAELAPFIPPTRCVCQSRTPVKSTVVTVNYLGAGTRDRCARELWRVIPLSSNHLFTHLVPPCLTELDSPKEYWDVWWFKDTVAPLRVALPHHTPSQSWEWGRHVQFHGSRWWWVVSRALTSPP